MQFKIFVISVYHLRQATSVVYYNRNLQVITFRKYVSWASSFDLFTMTNRKLTTVPGTHHKQRPQTEAADGVTLPFVRNNFFVRNFTGRK